MNLKPETLAKIEEVIPHYPVKRSAALPLLHLVQEDQGYLSNEAIEWIAAKLELQPINILELVTFYPMFRQKPIGRRLRHHLAQDLIAPVAQVAGQVVAVTRLVDVLENQSALFGHGYFRLAASALILTARSQALARSTFSCNWSSTITTGAVPQLARHSTNSIVTSPSGEISPR